MSGSSSALMRPIDPSIATNRAALAGAALAGLAGGAWHRWHLCESWGSSVAAGPWIGVMAFLAWACARELDPDRQWPALLALPIAAALSLTGSVHVAAGVLGLLAVRVVAGTTGLPLRGRDMPLLPLLAAWATVQSRSGLVTGIAMALAIAWSLRVGRVTPGTGRRAVHATLVALPLVTIGTALLSDHLEPRWATPHGWHLALEVAALAVAALAALLPVPPVLAPCDHPQRVLSTAHVRAARVLASACIVGALALGGIGQLAGLACIVAATAACVASSLTAQRRSPTAR